MKSVAAALAAGLVLAGGGALGQVPPGAREAQPPIQHRVSVTLKLVQAFVTDARGKPVLDLRKEDFILRDNGEPQAITEFEKYALTLPEAVTAKPGAPGETVGAPSPEGEAAPLLGRKFFFLIDYVRNDLEGVRKAGNAARQFMDTKVRPGDEAALFTFSLLGGLKLHEYLTKDHDKVRAAIGKLRDAPGITPVVDESGLFGHEPMGMEIMSLEVFGRHGGHAGTASRNLFAEVAGWAKTLAAIPGQKNVILFSRGFGAAVVRPGAGGSALFETMARTLASANAAVFSVNTTTGVADKIKLGVFPEPSLDYLSRTTGGKYFSDVNYYARIAAEIEDATANYYVLGYYVPEAWDGKYHEVRVEVARKGCTVHAQRGYFDPVPFGRLSPVEKHLNLLLLALGEASAPRSLEFPMTAAPFAAPGGGTGPGAGAGNALLVCEISVAAIRREVGDRAECVVLVLDGSKAIVDGRRVEVDWREFRAETVFLYTATALGPGRYGGRVIVRNLENGRAAVGSCVVEVAEVPAEGPVLFPPFFLAPGVEAGYLNIAPPAAGEGAAGAAAAPALAEIFPFPADTYAPLVAGLERGARSFGVVLPCLWREMRSAELGLSVRILPEGGTEGAEITAMVLEARSAGEADLYLLEIVLPELRPGRYRLEIEAGDEATGRIARTGKTFSIR